MAAEVRAALAQGDADAAVTHALEGYGPEVLGFLIGVLRDKDAAGDAFSAFCADVWHGLARFRGDSTLRTWMYAVARGAAVRQRRERYQRQRQPLSSALLGGLEARVRTQTATFQRTETRTAIDQLRAQLDADERTLLILRLDRKLAWNEIAAIMADQEPAAGPDELRKTAALLRKRFERVKDKLRELAAAAGLLDRH